MATIRKKQRRVERRAFRRRWEPTQKAAQALCAEFGYTCRVFDEVMSVGVKGDARAYEPVLEITGPYDPETLIRLSTKLTNSLPFSRIALVVPQIICQPPLLCRPGRIFHDI